MLATVAMIAGCSDELDQPIPGSLPAEGFYKTDKDAHYAMYAVYDALSNLYNSDWASMYLLKVMPGDDSNAGGGNDNDQAPYQQLDNFIHDSQNPHMEAVWNRAYSGIYRANQVINLTAGETDVQKVLIAEAKVIRAYLYLDLVSLWGDVPLVTEAVQVSDFRTTGRASKTLVYGQIEQDLTDAIPVLPLKSELDATNKFRVTKGTAQALLGKAYLYQQAWPSAVDAFEDIIGSGEYDLEKSVSAAFSYQGEFGKESVFELSYVNTQKYDWGNFPWGRNIESNIIVQLMGPRGENYTQAPGDTLTAGWGFNTPTQKIYDAFVDAGDNTRRLETLWSEEELEDRGGEWKDEAWDYEGFVRRKYGSFASMTAGPITELNYTTNWKLVRYADVLLMAAEANYRNGDEDKAREYLNDVRQRPGTNLPEVNATGEALFQAIVTERFLELAFEGHRYVDLVRWGLAATELADEGFVAGKHELLPIPNQDVIAGDLEQNPNY